MRTSLHPLAASAPALLSPGTGNQLQPKFEIVPLKHAGPASGQLLLCHHHPKALAPAPTLEKLLSQTIYQHHQLTGTTRLSQLRHGAVQGVSSALRRPTLHQAQDIPKETPFLSSRTFRMPDQPCLPVFVSWSRNSVLGLRTPRRTALMSTFLRFSINRQAVRGHLSADRLR